MLMGFVRNMWRQRHRIGCMLALLLGILPALSGGLGVPRTSQSGGAVSDASRLIRLATSAEEAEELLHAKPRKLTRRAERRQRLLRSYLCRSPRSVFTVTASPATRSTYPDEEPYASLRDPHLSPGVSRRGPPTA